MNDEDKHRAVNPIGVGELVIMQDGRRAVVEQVNPGDRELRYLVRAHNGERFDVEAGTILRAKVYASWVAPGSEWDGEERRRNYPDGTHGTEAPRRRADDQGA